MPLVVKTIFLSFLLLLSFATDVSAQVVINEYLPHPSSGPDWIELYSPMDSDISEYILKDTTSDMKILSFGVIIGPSTSTNCYVDVGNRLNNGGDTILLLQADGSLPAVDEHSYASDPGIDVSWCRTPDGEPWDTCTAATKTLIECDSLAPTPTNSPTPTNRPTSTPNPTSTTKPTPTIKKTPTPKLTVKPTVKAITTKKLTPTKSSAEIKPDEESQEAILGLRNQLSITPTKTPDENTKSKFPALAVIMIVGGISFMGVASYPFLKKKLSRYNLK